MFTREDWIRTLIQALLLSGVVSYLAYESFWIILFTIYPVLRWCIRSRRRQGRKRRCQQLQENFAESLTGLITAMSAGYSFESAFGEVYQELQCQLPETQDWMCELRIIMNRLSMNQTIETALEDLALRSGLDDLEQFAEVVQTAKRTGGNLIHIMKTTEETLSQRNEVNRHIELLLAAKQMEFRIMMLVPPGILLYLRVASPGFLSPLYHNVTGILFMTIALGLYLLAIWLANRMTAITCE